MEVDLGSWMGSLLQCTTEYRKDCPELDGHVM